ncbi:hypothetical protein CCHL11_01484 [Colletotrichum chlorophyti]|uniref:Uncharacterized protein n=1 Tax=Colletotrichum chlorophyti TaxID=708187 RepID=A0A1Q8RXX3_9PEZI|nr:hypothetical protein CCHL11_01484 [Colletotrichum chlorophyti]
MRDTLLPTGADKGHTQWDVSSSASSPRSAGSSNSGNSDSIFSSPAHPHSPANTELSYLSSGPGNTKHSVTPNYPGISIMPNLSNHVLVGHKAYLPGQIRVMRDELIQARATGEFPKTTSTVEDPQTIVEDYQHLQRLRDVRGDPSLPPPEKYNIVMVDIARRIKARDEAHGGSAELQQADHRVQSWMSTIEKEQRMIEITNAALRNKGINDPTQDDFDAIADELMAVAERTLLDVANPLRMNASRMAGNISRLDSQLKGLDSQMSGFDGAMAAQINGLSSLNDAVCSSMGAQVNTLNSVMTSQLNALNTIISAQSNTMNGSVDMLNTALSTVSTDLHQLTANLPVIVAAAVQAAIQEQLASNALNAQPQTTFEQLPYYTSTNMTPRYQATDGGFASEYTNPLNKAARVPAQVNAEKSVHIDTSIKKSKFKRLMRNIAGVWRFTRAKGCKEMGSR